MLADHRRECTQDFLGQRAARFAAGELGTFVGNFRQHDDFIAGGRPGKRHRNQGAAAGPREFSRGDGRGERPAKKLDLDAGAGGRAINQQGDQRTFLQPLQHFHESEGVLPDDERFDTPLAARPFAQLGEAGPRFSQGDDQQLHAQPAQQRRAKLPVAEVNSQQNGAAPRSHESGEAFGRGQLAEELSDRPPALVAQQIGEFDTEIAKQPGGGLAGDHRVASHHWQQILLNHPPPRARQQTIGSGQVCPQHAGERNRQPPRATQTQPPGGEAIEAGSRSRLGAGGHCLFLVGFQVTTGQQPPPPRQQKVGGDCRADRAGGADLAEAGQPGVARQSQGTETGGGGRRAQQQRPAGAVESDRDFAPVPAQRELHVDRVIHRGPEQQRHGHQVHQVPRPTGDGHHGQQKQPAEGQRTQAENHFRPAPIRGRQCEQEHAADGDEHPPEAAFDFPQQGGTKPIPTGHEDLFRLKFPGPRVDRSAGLRLDQTGGDDAIGIAGGQLAQNPAADGIARPEGARRIKRAPPRIKNPGGQAQGIIREARAPGRL